MGERVASMLSRLFDQIGPRPLGLTRVIIGAAALIRCFIALPVLLALTHPATLRVPYAEWVPDPTTPLVLSLISLWAVSALLFTLGWRVPLTGTILLVSIVSALALDQQTYGNHLYLMAWLVLLLTLASAGSGLDVHRRDQPVMRWPVLLLMAQLSIVYGFSAATKLNDTFLSGRVLGENLGTGLLGFPDALRTSSFLSIVAALALFVELFIAVFMWRRRFRPAAFILGLGLHISITLLMAPTMDLVIFSLEMFALYPLFLTQEKLVLVWDDRCDSCRDWVRRLERLDLLQTVESVGATDPTNTIPAADVTRSMHLIHAGETSNGFRAITGTLEHLVPTLWIAPLLRLPGVSQLGERWYRWQARKRSCAVGVGVEPVK